jgi:hypothetical protein
MLSVTVQFIVAMLAYGLNERMARKAEYLREENRVMKEALRAATGKTRIPLTSEQRQRLAAKGKTLTPLERNGSRPSRSFSYDVSSPVLRNTYSRTCGSAQSQSEQPPS